MPNRRELGYVSAGSTSTIVATTGYGVATGGTSSSPNIGGQDYTLLTFTSDDNLVVSADGLFDVLLCGAGGGGSGGNGSSVIGGGGGGGAPVQQTIFLTAGTYAVDIGAGGAGATGLHGWGTLGFPCVIGGSQINIQAAGGGFGSNYTGGTKNTSFNNGASGGGASGGESGYGSTIGNAYLDGVTGKNGGTGNTGANPGGAGGGGGFGGVGGNGSGATGGAGGAGFDVSAFISGSALFKCAGGGGGGNTGGAGGSGVGAAGSSTTASAAAANTASGGSGIVYVRFKV
jgi:hypothetical protein